MSSNSVGDRLEMKIFNFFKSEIAGGSAKSECCSKSYSLLILIECKNYNHPVPERFTLAHELGHHFLRHSKYMNGEYCDIADLKLDSSSTFEMDDLRRMDWQANYFASCLLLPRETLN